jgi:O-antigen/teichoic acid export membrane protein
MISKVTFPAMVKMKDNSQRVMDFYFKTFYYLCIINFPLAVGIICFTSSFFHIFYGNKWDAAILPTQILAVFGLLRGLFSGAGSVLMTIGRIRETFFILLGQLLLLLVFIYPVTVHFEVVGICILLSLLNIAMAIVFTLRLESLFPNTARRMLKLMTLPLIFSIIAILFPIKLLTLIFGEPNLWSFIGVAVLSCLLYLFAITKKDRQIIREIKDLYFSRL